jgi:hypothetical protein
LRRDDPGEAGGIVGRPGRVGHVRRNLAPGPTALRTHGPRRHLHQPTPDAGRKLENSFPDMEV